MADKPATKEPQKKHKEVKADPKPTQKNTEAKNAKHSKKQDIARSSLSSLLIGTTFIIMVGALSAFGYIWWQDKNQDEKNLSQVEAKLQKIDVDITNFKHQLTINSNEEKKATTSEIEQNKALINDHNTIINDLHQEISRLKEEVQQINDELVYAKNQTHTPYLRDLRLDEISELISMAERYSELGDIHNIDLTLFKIELAAKNLNQFNMDAQRFLEAIHIQRMRFKPQDVTLSKSVLSEKILSLKKEISLLPLRGEVAVIANNDADNNDDDSKQDKSFFQKAWQTVSKYIQVEKDGLQPTPILSNEIRQMIYERSKLLVDSIQVALLTNNYLLFHNKIGEAEAWVKQHFDTQSEDVTKWIESLKLQTRFIPKEHTLDLDEVRSEFRKLTEQLTF